MNALSPEVGDEFTLRIGEPVHGGHALARHEGRIVFVRHGAPGELARVRLTGTGTTWRGDAVEILEPSPDRVPVTWAAAGPGGVGAELAHLTLPVQREWKRAVLDDALRRIGKLDLPVTMSALPSDAREDSTGWGTRTRIELTADDQGRAAMFAHRSHTLIPLDEMPLAVEEIGALDLFTRSWPTGVRLTAVAPSATDPVVLVDGTAPAGHPGTVSERVEVAGRMFEFSLAAGGFWQIHRDAPQVLATEVLSRAGDLGGATVFDLFAGAGLLSLPLAAAVGTGRVHAIEGDRRAHQWATRNARTNGSDLRGRLHAHRGDVAATLMREDGLPRRADVVVLDPPRAGAKARVMAAIAARAPERIIYVACDPAALARDLAAAADLGYTTERVDGFDLFPHTHHVEAIAVLQRR